MCAAFIQSEMPVVLECTKTTYRDPLAICLTYCMSGWIIREDLGKEISLSLFILLPLCLSASLIFLSPSIPSSPVSIFPFFFSFLPWWVHTNRLQPRLGFISLPSFLCPCSSLGVHTSGFYHGCCCSCFPSISPTGQLPPLSFLFFLLCLNSMSLVCLVRPKFLCHSDLFLVCFFCYIMTWWTSHAVS